MVSYIDIVHYILAPQNEPRDFQVTAAAGSRCVTLTWNHPEYPNTNTTSLLYRVSGLKFVYLNV